MNKADKELIKRMTFIRRLLKEFGVTLSGYDPGVTGLWKDGKKNYLGKLEDRYLNLDLGGVEWSWLEPLLVELRTHRRKAKATV